jgi:hypothetical protein
MPLDEMIIAGFLISFSDFECSLERTKTSILVSTPFTNSSGLNSSFRKVGCLKNK